MKSISTFLLICIIIYNAISKENYYKYNQPKLYNLCSWSPDSNNLDTIGINKYFKMDIDTAKIRNIYTNLVNNRSIVFEIQNVKICFLDAFYKYKCNILILSKLKVYFQNGKIQYSHPFFEFINYARDEDLNSSKRLINYIGHMYEYVDSNKFYTNMTFNVKSYFDWDDNISKKDIINIEKTILNLFIIVSSTTSKKDIEKYLEKAIPSKNISLNDKYPIVLPVKNDFISLIIK
jgi:hypothetical protein